MVTMFSIVSLSGLISSTGLYPIMPALKQTSYPTNLQAFVMDFLSSPFISANRLVAFFIDDCFLFPVNKSKAKAPFKDIEKASSFWAPIKNRVI